MKALETDEGSRTLSRQTTNGGPFSVLRSAEKASIESGTNRCAISRLNFDHLKDQEFALIKDLGQKRGSLYWLRGWEVFEQIKRPLLNSRGFCFLLPSRSALKIWGDGVSNDGG